MSELKFRDLKADEIDVRISQITDKGLSLLLYKDARCDMNILDETVGAFNWQRTHTRDNANCVVSIWDETKSVWVSKEDTGTESNTEKEKGLASDSFKRACFNWGIGRELYTAPNIWIGAEKCEITKRNDGKLVCYEKFYVQDIEINDKKIVGITIGTVKGKKTVFSITKSKRDILRDLCKKNGIDTRTVIQVCGLNQNSTDEDYLNAIAYVKQNLGA